MGRSYYRNDPHREEYASLTALGSVAAPLLCLYNTHTPWRVLCSLALLVHTALWLIVENQTHPSSRLCAGGGSFQFRLLFIFKRPKLVTLARRTRLLSPTESRRVSSLSLCCVVLSASV